MRCVEATDRPHREPSRPKRERGTSLADDVRMNRSFPLPLLVLLFACEGGSPAAAGSGPPIGVPPLLGPDNHPGWTNPECQLCHSLPVAGHTVTERYVCAQCHGANGACVTNGFNDGYNEHVPEDDCASCHVDDATGAPGNHGFTASEVCSNCHFRELGQRECVPPIALCAQGEIGAMCTCGEEVQASGYCCGAAWSATPCTDEPLPTGGPLATGCFDYPEAPFSATNRVADGHEWESILKAGDVAVDFTLEDTNGVEHSLYELLESGPVWLQTGSYTCPVYQNAVEGALNEVVRRGNADGPYAEQIQFVHVYTVEAHPIDPDVSPYGSRRQFEVSTVRQPTTYGERVANARLMEPLVDGELMLVDALEPTAEGSNPVWCTYATCPACSFLIGRDRRIYTVIERTPNEAADLVSPLDDFLRVEGP